MAFSWMKDPNWVRQHASKNLASWLIDVYHLSRNLKQGCAVFSIDVICEQFESGLEDEQPLLQQSPQALPWVRQVYLKRNGQPYCYGRVVVPYDTFIFHQSQLTQLSKHSVGEQLLYRDPNILRSPFEFAYVPCNDPRCIQAMQTSDPQSIEALWARRSSFQLKGGPLMVTELFLPNMSALPLACELTEPPGQFFYS